MLSKPRESGKHKNPNSKRNSAPSQQIQGQTMLLNGGQTNNAAEGDILDLFSSLDQGTAAPTMTTSQTVNPFLDVQHAQPSFGGKSSKSVNDVDLFGDDFASDPFGTKNNGGGDLLDGDTHAAPDALFDMDMFDSGTVGDLKQASGGSLASGGSGDGDDSPPSPQKSKGGKKKKKKAPKVAAIEEKDEEEVSDDDAADNADTKADEQKKEETNALEELHRGSALLKYPRRSGFPHFKHIELSKDNSRLQWYSKRKDLDSTCILIKDIREIVNGQKTETFKKFQQKTLDKSSFSIVYGMDYKTLDVAAKSIDECKMWVNALNELHKLSRNGGSLAHLRELYVGVTFKDRNRPKSRQGSGNFIRANNSNKVRVDPDALKEIQRDMDTLQKNFDKVTNLTLKSNIQQSEAYGNIQTVLSEIEERMEELNQELTNIRDTELAKREVWRANVDLNAIMEKAEVLAKLMAHRKK